MLSFHDPHRPLQCAAVTACDRMHRDPARRQTGGQRDDCGCFACAACIQIADADHRHIQPRARAACEAPPRRACVNQYLRKEGLQIDELFSVESVKERVLEYLPTIPNQVARLKSVVNRDTQPEIEIGEHCDWLSPIKKGLQMKTFIVARGRLELPTSGL